MKNKSFVLFLIIFLLIMLLVLSFIELPVLIQNVIYFVFGLIGSYFIFNYYFVGMNEEERKSWNIKLGLDKKKKEE